MARLKKLAFPKLYMGIDPGITGAVSLFIDKDTIKIFDTPTVEIRVGKSVKNEYVPEAMADILRIAPRTEQESQGRLKTHVYIEKVGAMPGQGVTSMFNFGKGFGIWLGILAALKIPHTLITPQSWKKEMLHGMSKDKDVARLRACQLFPNLSEQLKRKKDIGRADALLIGEFCRRMQP